MRTGANVLDINRDFYNTAAMRNEMNKNTARAQSGPDVLHFLPGQFQEKKENFMDLIGEKKKEIYDKIKSGEMDGAVQIGGSIFTASEWDMIMKRIDSTLNKEESAIKESPEPEEGQDKSIGEITEEMMDALFHDKDKKGVTGDKNASGTEAKSGDALDMQDGEKERKDSVKPGDEETDAVDKMVM